MPDSNSIRTRNTGIRNTYRLSLKELKEILRDRRTILTLVAMPLLIYPLLSILLQKFYLTSAKTTNQLTYTYVLEPQFVDSNGKPLEEGDEEIPDIDDEKLVDDFIAQYINLGEAYAFPELAFPPEQLLKPLEDEGSIDPRFVDEFEHRYFEDNRIRVLKPDEKLDELVESGKVDCGIRIFRAVRRPSRIEIVQLKSGVSSKAADYLRKRVDLTNAIMSRLQIARANAFWLGREYSTTSLEGAEAPPSISMSSLVPLILILMTVTGAVYPAIDLTAGERERGTLEALIAAPVPRFQVLFAKFIGVLTVAMLTAVVNMIGMFATLAMFGLLPVLFGEESFGWLPILQIFALLFLFAGFFSAVLLAITSFARSFKEAQAYVVPVTLLSITPGIFALTPTLELSGIFTVIPLMNIVLLAREIMEGSASSLPAIVAITSTAFYGVAALSVAAHVFGSDSILYGSQSSWRSMLRRPKETTDDIPVSRATTCLAVLFPLSFVSLALVGRVPMWYASQRGLELSDVPYWVQLVPFVISTVFVFVLVPSFFLWHGRIGWLSSLRFRRPGLWAILAAVLIGSCLWPLTGQLVESVNRLSQVESGEPEWRKELLRKAKEIVENWRTISPVIILFCFSLIPAVCEEIFFRGVLLRSIASRNKAWIAIVLSAFIFGVFHTLSLTDLASQKFMPSFLAGLFLAWIAMRSGSILPGMLLHVLNNGILVSLAYFEDRLVADGWIDSSQSGFPAWGLLLAGSGVAAGSLILIFLVRPKDGQTQPVEPESNPKEDEA